jgi:predicted TIM-barrel fold metal-dependent hydrolase
MRRAPWWGLLLAPLALSCADCGARPPSPPPAPTPAAPRWVRPPVIDAHTHINPRGYDQMMALADQSGIARVVNLSGGHQGKGLEPHLEAMRRHPGRIAAFYNLEWRALERPDFAALMAGGLEDAVAQGYRGLKISKALGLGVQDAQGAYLAVDDPRLDAIWQKAGALGVPVAIHTGDPKAFFEPVDARNERLEELTAAPHWSFADPSFPRREVLLAQRDRLLARHRGTTFILVHFGNNPEDIDYVDRVLDAHPNAVVDVSARLAEIGRHDPEEVRALFLKHRDRILFGTDLGVSVRGDAGSPPEVSLFLGSISTEPPTLAQVKPFYDSHWRFFEADHRQVGAIPHPIPIQGRWQVQPIHLPPEVLQALYHDNAARLIFKDP